MLDAFEKVAIVYGFEEVEKLEDTAWAYLGVYLRELSSSSFLHDRLIDLS